MSRRSDTIINPELAELMKASRDARTEAIGDALSPRIAAHLGDDAKPLAMRWQVDPRSPKRRPTLYALPSDGTPDEECERFAEAVAVLTDGTFKSVRGEAGTITFTAATRRAGVDVELQLVVWGYDNPTKYARRLPDLIQRHRRA